MYRAVTQWNHDIQEVAWRTYDRIETGLETIGIKKEKIEKLTKQLKELKEAVDECTKLQADCDNITQVCKSDSERWTIEISVITKLFEDNIKQMKDTEREFIQALYALFGLAGGVAVGGTIGTTLLPGVGTVVGACRHWWSYRICLELCCRERRTCKSGKKRSKLQGDHIKSTSNA